jgi:S-adenosyl-L-methionine hydrolase (adenosine-forming)
MSIVTFTTDFGGSDGYVGAMKGVVVSRSRGCNLVDICHNIPKHDVAAGAFALAQAAPYFPPGTIHVVVVDPGVGGRRDSVIAVAKNQLFVGPDNGVLSLAAVRPDAVFAIEAPAFRRDPVSPTFHGRDVFAAAAGLLAAGAPPEDAGRSLAELIPLPSAKAEPMGMLSVMHVDHFGNVITSLKAGKVVGNTKQLLVNGTTFAWEKTYCDVPVGSMVAYVGSSGYVELAVREGAAAESLSVVRNQILSWEAVTA